VNRKLAPLQTEASNIGRLDGKVALVTAPAAARSGPRCPPQCKCCAAGWTSVQLTNRKFRSCSSAGGTRSISDVSKIVRISCQAVDHTASRRAADERLKELTVPPHTCGGWRWVWRPVIEPNQSRLCHLSRRAASTTCAR
jgi:hypothetical protein